MKRALKRHILEERYADLYSVAEAMLHDEDDAKDAVQDALVKTLVKSGVKDPYAYCLTTLRHRCIETLRRRNRLASIDNLDELCDVEPSQMERIVNEKKRELDDVRRAMLELHYEEGYTLAEVAAITALSVSTVKRMLHDTRNELKRKIEQEL